MTDIIQYLEWTVSGSFGRFLGSVIILGVIGSGLSISLASVSNAVRNAVGRG